MKYAVIKTGGKQYKVAEGQTIVVEKLKKPSSNEDLKNGQPVEFDQVLLLVEGDKAKVGQPTLNTKIKGKIVDQVKAQKIHVLKYKAKTGYHRKIGHRQKLTKVLIEKIGV